MTDAEREELNEWAAGFVEPKPKEPEYRDRGWMYNKYSDSKAWRWNGSDWVPRHGLEFCALVERKIAELGKQHEYMKALHDVVDSDFYGDFEVITASAEHRLLAASKTMRGK